MSLTILTPLHTAILVSNLERSRQFYSEILGLQPVDRVLKYPGLWYQIGPYQLHLIVDEQAPSGLHNPEKWGRNRHVALGVADVDAAAQYLEQQGYPVQRSASGRSALFVQDPDGNVVELSQVELS